MGRACREKRRAHAATYRSWHQAAGLCITCPARRAPGDGWYCHLHRVAQRRRAREHKRRRRAEAGGAVDNARVVTSGRA